MCGNRCKKRYRIVAYDKKNKKREVVYVSTKCLRLLFQYEALVWILDSETISGTDGHPLGEGDWVLISGDKTVTATCAYCKFRFLEKPHYGLTCTGFGYRVAFEYTAVQYHSDHAIAPVCGTLEVFGVLVRVQL